MIFQKIIIAFLCCVFALAAAAQGGIYGKATLDKKKILIGEPLQLTIEAEIPGDAVIRFFNIDSIAHFEFLKHPVIDTISTSGGTRIRGVYTITSFDSGHWVIPSFVLSEHIVTDSLPVDVGFSPFDPVQDYHDIKDIIPVNPATNKPPWGWIAAGALLLGAVVYFLSKKKKRQLPVPVVYIDPYEEAMKELEKTANHKPGTKEYYTKLVAVFRIYIFRKKGILSLQETTDDLISQLQSLKLDDELFQHLGQALMASDSVKFAKYIPLASDDIVIFNTIKKAIQAIEELP